MPEGPEIRLAADQVENVLRGCVIESVEFGIPDLQKYSARLAGHKVLRVETRGKAMLTHFEHGYSIYSHNQLYGVWRVVRRGKLPSTGRQLRMALHTEKHSALLYSASDISVWKSVHLNQHPFLQRIGPDVLGGNMDSRTIVHRLNSQQFRGRALSSLMLDQAFLAGTGNYLRSEILFAARVNPMLKAADLDAAARNRLARQTLLVTHRSYKNSGVTLTQKQYRHLRAVGQPHGKARFMVFGRAGMPCRICESKIKRREAGARRLYYCPVCQR